VAQIRPFTAVRYFGRTDVSDVIAPPYDVLDEAGKAALLKKNPKNIVTIDLPHLPAKTVGPDSAYQKANDTLSRFLSEGILARDSRPAYYAYAQTYTHGQRTYNRRGFFALVKLSPFGAGEVYPHEKTYPDAITDRLKLTRATRMQLSPIFGLFSDAENSVTGKLFAGLKEADVAGTMDAIRNELWTITDPATQQAVTDMMASRSIYIADGHHRYTMALQYQKERGVDYVLFVLIAMQDPGLLILPTHRIIGGLGQFDPAALRSKLGFKGELNELPAQDVARYADQILPTKPDHTFGLYDGRTKKLYELTLTDPDVLQSLEPNQSQSWRSLDVAILQRYLLDELLSDGRELTRSYTADPNAIAGMTDGASRQVALLLKPTPLNALVELGKHNEVMPQKSTYFFPKLATGMVMNPLD
jgi:uncharacterized protein (DUF1015 family)